MESSQATQEGHAQAGHAHDSHAQDPHGHPTGPLSRADVLKLSLGALGVVYGDIGTSPIYAVRECMNQLHVGSIGPDAPSIEFQTSAIFSVISLILWSLILVVIVKYLTFVMRADNRGEGGILALLALIIPERPKPGAAHQWKVWTVVVLGLFGAALLFADGMITPAISVLSAAEGLEVATTVFKPLVIPITVVILVGLFWVQKFGTGNIGKFFGPAMLVWFLMIGLMGIPWIFRHPEILKAANPYYGAWIIIKYPTISFFLMAFVVLSITGAEALYADMGHFGKSPIRAAWYSIVFPALIFNYFGQGAFYLSHPAPEALGNPFFSMVIGPHWLIYPVIVITTIATIIASQALISGAYSLTQQAMQLGFCPRLTIVHTNIKMAGQIYIPEINAVLMVACVCLVLGFKTSSDLAAAYGIAVMGTMGITTSLLYVVAMKRWKWPAWKTYGITVLFLATDIPFFLSNLTKIWNGGWFPILVATGIFIIMTTWYRGRALMVIPERSVSLPLKLFLDDAKRHKPHRVEGTAIFMASQPDVVPNVLLHHFKHNQVLHRQVVLLHVDNKPVPHAFPEERLKVKDWGDGFFVVEVAYGFMEDPEIPAIIADCAELGLKTEPMSTSYYLGRATLLPTGRAPMIYWRKSLFSFLYHNERPATAFFQLPPNRVIELGRQVEL